MGKLRVGIVFGGRSGEHEVSLMSAASVLKAINREKYEPIPIGITKEGSWIVNNPLETLQQSAQVVGERLPVDLLHSLDVAFPVLHGPYGEDGTIQGLFEMLNVPYVGAGVTGSAVGMDKRIMKQVFHHSQLPVVDFLTYLRREWRIRPQEILEEISTVLGFPCFVKPVNLGSSVGISKARSAEELKVALDLACRFDREVMVEQFVRCREIECSVLGNDEPEASLPGEVVPQLEFYNYEAKYTDGKSDFFLPAPLNEKKAAEIQELAIKAFLAVNCWGMARVDFFLDKETEAVYVNELNTIPGFTQLSMYPKMWESSGLQYSQLVDRLITLGLEKFAEKQENQVSKD